MQYKGKVGIITLYYKNDNYGGIAQAYALNIYLCSLGYQSELISYQKLNRKQESFSTRLRKHIDDSAGFIGYINCFFWILNWLKDKFVCQRIKYFKMKKYQPELSLRKMKFEEFRNSIPHSRVYTAETIESCGEDYDIFVSGSDQIWKPGVIQDAFVLGFVPEDKIKLSYASSITISNFTKDHNFSEYLKEKLDSYSSISVREKSTKIELQELLEREVEWVVDPTLLLEKEHWKSIASKRLISEPYIFTYLLGDSSSQKEYINTIAKQAGLKIVALPFVDGKYNISDVGFGDYRLFDVGLPEFFSLIQYAECVITDSFHAVCFSRAFKKLFYVFERKVAIESDRMNSRIESILEMMGLQDRIITTMDQITFNKPINYNDVENRLSKYIDSSKRYLEQALMHKGKSEEG